MNLYALPQGLPVPEDDGATAHLVGQRLPDVALASTSGRPIQLSSLTGWSVIYCYPMTGRPDTALPDGWDDVPGARGCTPQSCAYRDHYAQISELGAQLFGLSTQCSAYQKEMVERLHLPFPVLSDADLILGNALALPIIKIEGKSLIKRLTLICEAATIRQVHYPVFPPQEDPIRVITWLKTHC